MMDEARFRALYNEMYPRLWAYTHRLVMDRGQSDDIVQESFLRFLGSTPTKLDEAGMRSYLYKIATNLVRDSWRKNYVEERWLAEQPDEEQDVTGSPRVDLRMDLNRALELLDAGQRSLVWLAYVEGYAHEEIARIVGVKPASVRVLLMRARRRLAAVLTESNPAREEQ